MSDAVLIADIGGTKSWVALAVPVNDGDWEIRSQSKRLNDDYGDPFPLIQDYLQEPDNSGLNLTAAALAVAGPIDGDQVDLTNLPWSIDAGRLKRQLDLDHLLLINDFQAAALGISLLGPNDRISLNRADIDEEGLAVITGAGTGLGLALVGRCGQLTTEAVHPTEAGHADFAPATEQELRLVQYLRETFAMEHISWEHLLSGNGLVLMDAFIRNQDHKVLKTPASVTASAERKDIAARHAIRLFWDIYAAWVGNVALMYRPLGGLYLFGGMAMRLRPWFEKDRFLELAADRAAMQHLVRETPLFLVTDEQLALKGALVAARKKYYRGS